MLRRFIRDNLVQFGIRFNLLIGGFLAFLHFGLGFGFVAPSLVLTWLIRGNLGLFGLRLSLMSRCFLGLGIFV